MGLSRLIDFRIPVAARRCAGARPVQMWPCICHGLFDWGASTVGSYGSGTGTAYLLISVFDA